MNTIIKKSAIIITENPNNHITSYIAEYDCTKEYALLGLSEGFTKEDLEKAYRKARIKFHPDKLDGNKEKFQQVIDAYQKFKDLLGYLNITQR